MNKRKRSSLLCSCLLLGLLLGSYKGSLALWRDQDPIPYKIFPYPVSALPPEAQRDLQKGIPIDSIEDVQSLLEKYLP